VGLGTEILFMLLLGLVVLVPKQMHTLLGHVARAKAQFEQIRSPTLKQWEKYVVSVTPHLCRM